MSTRRRGQLALLSVALLLLQLLAVGATVAADAPEDDGDRLPSGYLTVFMDDFERDRLRLDCQWLGRRLHHHHRVTGVHRGRGLARRTVDLDMSAVDQLSQS